MPVLAFFGAIALIVFSAIFNGYALSVLWGWFVVPVFSVPSLSVGYAIGLAMVVSFLTHQRESESKSNSDSVGEVFAKSIVYALLHPTISLFFGWVVKLFL